MGKQITQLPAAIALTGSDVVLVQQAGITKQASISLVAPAATDASLLTSGTLAAARLPGTTGAVLSSVGSNVMALSTTGIAAGAYGSGSLIPIINVGVDGRILSAVPTAVIIPQTFSTLQGTLLTAQQAVLTSASIAALTAYSATLTAPVLGTPTSGTLTNCTGLPVASGISGLGSNVATFLATPSSANLAAAVTGETGTGNLVFSSGPTFDGTMLLQTATATGKIVAGACDGTNGSFVAPHGTAPASPLNGELWTTSGGFFARINANTEQMARVASPAFTGTASFATAQATLLTAQQASLTSASIASLAATGLTTLAAVTEGVNAAGTVGASSTLSIGSNTEITATLTSATPCTFTMPSVAGGKSFQLLLRQPASGSATTATFTGVRWSGGTAPTITATLGRMDILSFKSDGTNWYGSFLQNFTY